ncbi:RNA pseudouridine synthase [Bacillus methanolicus]|uniref:RluA family pseudouridine synthase n=1 Tax=Bacillus methanolicus TaxID=1471 RepID=UPI002380A361|nr:RluA family pseudouridine synthase [Bacillus methanolicus]MDE3838240.1 RNA pseudouridine synthase [Bacillus methanolicus]
MKTKCFTLTWKIDSNEKGILVREFLKEQNISKTALTDIKYHGGKILVNEKEVTVRYQLVTGDELTVIFPEEKPSEGVSGEEIPLDILYEDEYLLVINKPSGMNTIPSREHPSGSLANALVGYYNKIGLISTSHIVTRLDRDTSGIVLAAKHRHVHHLISKQQKSGLVKRTYEAFAEGFLKQESGKIEEPIARKSNSIIEREVNPDGQYACTYYKVIKKYSSFSHVQLQLETGRTHQIRVHLSYLGHPLLGDDLYGGDTSIIKRQALHCSQLVFFHPFRKKDMEFRAELPEDMRKLIVEG